MYKAESSFSDDFLVHSEDLRLGELGQYVFTTPGNEKYIGSWVIRVHDGCITLLDGVYRKDVEWEQGARGVRRMFVGESVTFTMMKKVK